jgi:integration host factor subunit alpha
MPSVKKLKLTKAHLVDAVTEKIGLNRREGAEIFEQLFESIIERLSQKEEVNIQKFGRFELKEKKARPGRNPKTGEPAIVSARTSVVFHPSVTLRKKINPDLTSS